MNWHFCCLTHDPFPFLTKVLLPDLSSGYKLKMTEVQAMVEFSVELNKFYNVDLFQRGYVFYSKNLITDCVSAYVYIYIKKSCIQCIWVIIV